MNHLYIFSANFLQCLFIQQSDIIIALGSCDIRVADRAAELWHDRYAEYILFSGKTGNLLRGNIYRILQTILTHQSIS